MESLKIGKRRMAKVQRNLIVGALLACTVGVVSAAEVVWTGAAQDGAWATAGNWQGGATPAAGDTAIVEVADSLTFDTSMLTPLGILRKTGAGELTVHDSLVYSPEAIEVQAGTLKIGTRSSVGASARFWPGTFGKTAPGTLLWRNTRLSDVKWISGRASGGYFSPRQVMQPWYWAYDSETDTATVQFQLWNGANTMTDTLKLVQNGDDVYAYITYACYSGSNVLGANMASGYTTAYKNVPNNYNLQDVQPLFDLPDGQARFTDVTAGASGDGELVFRNIELRNVVAFTGAGGGGNLAGITQYPGYIISNNGVTANVEFRAFYKAGNGTFGVFVVFKQIGADVYARAVLGAYKGNGLNVVNSRMFNDAGGVLSGMSSVTVDRYNVRNIRPVLSYSPDVVGAIVVANGARLDVNLAQGATSDPNATESTHGKCVKVAGTGPDGEGALYNSNLANEWGATFGQVVLTGDTRVGGGVLDICAMDKSAAAVVSGEARLEGDYTLTTAGMRFGLNGVQLNVWRIVNENYLIFSGVNQGQVAEGVVFRPGSRGELSAATVPNGVSLKFEAGDPVALDVTGNSASQAGGALISSGATVNLVAEKELTLSGAVTNEGAVVNTGASALVLAGTLEGTGSFTGAFRFGGTNSVWKLEADEEGFTRKCDLSGVTSTDIFAGLARLEITYIGFNQGKCFALGPAGNLTGVQAAEIELSVVGYNGMPVSGCQCVIKDNQLQVMIGDPTIPRTVYWTAAGQDPTDFNDPANWRCLNDFGQVLANALPTYTSVVHIEGALFPCGAGTTLFPCKEIHFQTVLSADRDCSGLDMSLVVGGTVDLAGHNLKLLLTANPVNALTITDSSTANGGTLTVEVPQGVSLTNEKVSFAGSLAFVKRGAGTYVSKVSNSYTGGTTVAEGAYWIFNNGNNTKTWAIPTYKHFGATNTTVTVESGAQLDLRGTYGMKCYPVVLNGGTFANTGYQHSGTADSLGGIGALTLTADSTWHQNAHMVFHGDGHTIVAMNKHTLTMRIDSGVNYAYLSDFEFDSGTVDVVTGGAFAPFGEGVVTTNAVLKMSAVLAPWSVSKLGDFEMRCTANSAGGEATSQLQIYGTYTPTSNYIYHMFMQNGSTIDLSERELPFAIKSTLVNGKLDFAENAKVWIDIGAKMLHSGDLVLSWAAADKPTNVTFAVKSGSGVPRGVLRMTDAGLEFYTGFSVIIR